MLTRWPSPNFHTEPVIFSNSSLSHWRCHWTPAIWPLIGPLGQTHSSLDSRGLGSVSPLDDSCSALPVTSYFVSQLYFYGFIKPTHHCYWSHSLWSQWAKTKSLVMSGWSVPVTQKQWLDEPAGDWRVSLWSSSQSVNFVSDSILPEFMTFNSQL